ncbi:MAG: hypothetical protein NXI04_22100 [Planctomycetaceae bacterium]|nr:hypothetical protein [Planctomycetaceae bacterium]
MDRYAAQSLATNHPADVIRQQIEWLDDRNPTKNRIGMFRKSLELRWDAPKSVMLRHKRSEQRQKDRQQAAKHRQEDAAIILRRTDPSTGEPHFQVLDAIAAERQLPTVSSVN